MLTIYPRPQRNIPKICGSQNIAVSKNEVSYFQAQPVWKTLLRAPLPSWCNQGVRIAHVYSTSVTWDKLFSHQFCFFFYDTWVLLKSSFDMHMCPTSVSRFVGEMCHTGIHWTQPFARFYPMTTLRLLPCKSNAVFWTWLLSPPILTLRLWKWIQWRTWTQLFASTRC